MAWKRFNYKGTKEQLPKVEAALEKLRVTRKSMYLILRSEERRVGKECL